jgi:hypothetical protein
MEGMEGRNGRDGDGRNGRDGNGRKVGGKKVRRKE